MTLSIRDTTTDKLVRTLAKKKGIALTEAVRLAVGNELAHLDEKQTLRERIAVIRRGVVARGRAGEQANKAFFDNLGGDF